MQLAKANGTQVQMIPLVLYLFTIASTHQAVVPRAMLQAKHVTNLMEQRLE